MSDLTIGPAALYIVGETLTKANGKRTEEKHVTPESQPAVVSNVRENQVEALNRIMREAINSADDAKVATLVSSDLIKGDISAALTAQAANLPESVLDLLED